MVQRSVIDIPLLPLFTEPAHGANHPRFPPANAAHLLCVQLLQRTASAEPPVIGLHEYPENQVIALADPSKTQSQYISTYSETFAPAFSTEPRPPPF
jgi:hypothetical protein